jgi:hypothetical protein
VLFLRICGALLLGIISIRGQASLSIDRMEFHQYEDGPTLDAAYEFLPGETVWFSSRMSGFQTEQEENDKHVKLTWQLTVSDPLGISIEKAQAGKIEDRLLPEDKEWRPKFLASYQLPPFAVGGSYKISVKVKDELSGKETSRVLEFPVKAPAPFKTDSLVVRNFRFLRNEDDKLPLRPAVYRPGTMLWAKFDIAGHKFADSNNRFSVGYGLAILAADGKQLFVQEEAAEESKESFYPQRWVPGALSLSLDANVGAATYTLVVMVRDRLAGESTELREIFQVE